MFSAIFTNWQTTVMGVATIASVILHAFGLSVPAELSSVLAGAGLVLAQDGTKVPTAGK